MIVGTKIAKETGLDADARVCPRHSVRSPAEIASIIMGPYKTYKLNKKTGRDEVVGMGATCPRCGYTERVDMGNKAPTIAIPAEDAGKAVESSIRLSPADPVRS